MSKPKTKRYVIVPGLGDPCPRCCQPTEIREHQKITAKHLRQPFYFRRWFNCMNSACKAQMICPERHKVWNAHLKVKEVKEAATRGQVVWGDSWDNVGVDVSVPPWE
jgi:hypothetical protein